MSLINLLNRDRKAFKFEDLISIFDLSPGYSRKVIADLVKKDILQSHQDKLDKRKVVYSLNWVAFRKYLFEDPSDYDAIIIKIVGKEHLGRYVAIDQFKVIESEATLEELIQTLGVIAPDSSVFLTSVGRPDNLITLETN